MIDSKKMAMRCFAQTLSLVLAFVVLPAEAQSVLAPGGTPPAVPNPLVAAAQRVGVQRCLPVLASLSSIGVRHARRSDVLFDWDHQRPDAGAVFALIGLDADNDNAAMSIAAAPGADGTCAVAAERTAYDTHSCKQVAQRELSGYQATPLLPHMTVYTSAREPGSTVSLIDSAPGCLTIRRYVDYGSASRTAAGYGRAR
jgi:hypothetical protein